MTEGESPYKSVARDLWHKKTVDLIQAHPLSPRELLDLTIEVWQDIFKSGIGKKPFRIGVGIFPKPQIMSFFLHELIALELARRYPRKWRPEKSARDKDVVYVPDERYSIEIKGLLAVLCG